MANFRFEWWSNVIIENYLVAVDNIHKLDTKKDNGQRLKYMLELDVLCITFFNLESCYKLENIMKAIK